MSLGSSYLRITHSIQNTENIVAKKCINIRKCVFEMDSTKVAKHFSNISLVGPEAGLGAFETVLFVT